MVRQKPIGQALTNINRSFLLKLALLWGLFFSICLSLGYPTLNRYTPAKSNISDTVKYHNLIKDGFVKTEESHWRYRVLVPYVAKPFYHLGKGRIGSWDPLAFGLLIANALFLSAAAIVLVLITRQLRDDIRPGLLSGLLLLANFNISNLYLSGLIDSGEIFLVTFLAWALIKGYWGVLPIIGIFGALTKETCIPITVSMASGWFLKDWLAGRFDRKHFVLIIALGLTSLITLAALKFAGAEKIRWPWENLSAVSTNELHYFSDLMALLLNRNIYYTFIWLLPLGVLGLRYVPRGWVWGSAATTAVILLLSAAIGVGDNVSRPLFSAMGPILTVAASLFLWSFLSETQTVKPAHG